MAKRWTAALMIFITAAIILGIASQFVYPDVSRLARERPAKTSFMEYREQQWQKEGLHKRIRHQWVPLGRISPYAVKAVIIAEDDKFWSHEGFDFEAIQKAFEKDLKRKRFRAGGSTISQQLAKNLYLTPARNPIRKFREVILTWRLERNLSKRRIIELYLNVAEWGDAIFGIEAASHHYFGKSAADLTPREAAQLAVVLPSPLRYHPTKGGAYVQSRAEAIYRIMLRRGIVIPDYDETMGPDTSAGTGAVEGEREAPGGGTGMAGTTEGKGETPAADGERSPAEGASP